MDDQIIPPAPTSSEEPPPAPFTPQLTDLDAVWTRKLRDAQRRSIEHSDPFIACLAKHDCDLLEIADLLQRVGKASLAGKTPSLKRIARLRPLIETTVKVSRQIERLARITGQVKGDEAPSD